MFSESANVTTTQMILSFIVLLLIASLTAYYADRKGRSFTIWFVLGVFLGILAPVILFFLPSLNGKAEESDAATMTVSPPDPSLQTLPQAPPFPNLLDQSEEGNKLWYYLDKDHQQMGPVSLIALKDLWNRGLLELNSFVWSEGMNQWQRVDELPKLKESLARV